MGIILRLTSCTLHLTWLHVCDNFELLHFGLESCRGIDDPLEPPCPFCWLGQIIWGLAGSGRPVIESTYHICWWTIMWFFKNIQIDLTLPLLLQGCLNVYQTTEEGHLWHAVIVQPRLRRNSIARVCLKRTAAPSVLLNPSYRIHIGHGMPNCIQSVDIHSWKKLWNVNVLREEKGSFVFVFIFV